MTDQEVLTTHNDVEMIRRPHLWPHRRLPLKNPTIKDSHNFPKCAWIDSPREPLTLHIGTIFGASAGEETQTYNTAEEVVADGWIVD